MFDDFLAATGLTDVCGVLDCGTDADRIDKFVFRGGSGVVLEPLDHVFERERFVRPTDGEPLSDHDALHVPFRWRLDEGAAGSIRGRVTDAAGAPVAGAHVWAYAPGDGWTGTAGALTAADGSYQIDGLPAGDYQVSFLPVAVPGLRPEWFDSTSRAGATPVAVTAAGVTPGIDAELDAAASVSGTVTDEAGDPVAGVQVWAYAPGDWWIGTAWALTDAAGHYSIEGLPAGSYQVRLGPVGLPFHQEWFDDSTTRAGATPVAVAVGSPAPPVDAVLAPR